MKCVSTNQAQAWQSMRSVFNHDWLTSRFDRDLYAWMFLFSGEKEDDVFNRDTFESTLLSAWASRRQDVHMLISDYEMVMSPASLVEEAPLSALPEDIRIWLKELVHILWKARCNVDRQKQDVSDAVDRVDDIFKEVSDRYYQQGFDALIGDTIFLGLLKECIQCCRLLGAAISRLNHEIEVV